MTTSSTDRDAWMQMHSALWGGRRWGSLVLQVSGITPGKDPHLTPRGVAPVADGGRLWGLVEGAIASGQQAYLSVGCLDPAVANRAGRGRKDDTRLITALWADLDVRSGVHAAGDALPTEDEVRGWLDDYLPGPPTVLVHTGGGLHAWWRLDEPIDPATDDGRSLLAAHKSWWTWRAHRAERKIDEGVLADPARILRPAGTMNFKTTPPAPVRLLECDPDRRIQAVYVLITALDVPAPKPRPVVHRPLAPASPRVHASAATRLDGVRPGDAMAEAVPVETIVEAVLGLEQRTSDGWGLPGADHDQARVYSDDGASTVTIFSASLQAALGLPDASHRLTSFSLLAAAAGGYPDGYHAAAHFATRWAGCWDGEAWVSAARELARPALVTLTPEVSDEPSAPPVPAPVVVAPVHTTAPNPALQAYLARRASR